MRKLTITFDIVDDNENLNEETIRSEAKSMLFYALSMSTNRGTEHAAGSMWVNELDGNALFTGTYSVFTVNEAKG